MANIYWHKTGADAHWATYTGNWWQDAGFTIPATDIPQYGDDVYLDTGTPPTIYGGEPFNAFSTLHGTDLYLKDGGGGDLSNAVIFANVIAVNSYFSNAEIKNSLTMLGNSSTPAGSVHVRGNLYMHDNVYNDSEVDGNLYAFGISVSGCTVHGDAHFYDQAYNDYGVIDGSFFYHGGNASRNPTGLDSGGSVGGSVTFDYGIQFNIGTAIDWASDTSAWTFLTGTPVWNFDNSNGTGHNNGVLTGNATFSGNYVSNGSGSFGTGTVTGTVTMKDGCSITDSNTQFKMVSITSSSPDVTGKTFDFNTGVVS